MSIDKYNYHQTSDSETRLKKRHTVQSLSAKTAPVILIYECVYCTLAACYMFRPVAILRQLTTKWLKTHSNKLVLMILLSYLFVSCLTVATGRNM